MNKNIYLPVFILLSSCSVSNNLSLKKNVTNFPKDRSSLLLPQLECFGDMYSEYRSFSNASPKRIAVVSIKDETGSSKFSDEIPSNMSAMAITALTKIGGSLRVVHIPTFEELKKVGINSGISENRYFGKNYNLSLYDPGTLLVYGTLTEYAKVGTNRKNKTDTNTSLGGGKWETTLGYNKSFVKTHGRMAMDFRIVNTLTGITYNASTSSSYIDIYQNSNTNEFSLSTNGNSIGLSSSLSVVDARHSALRALIEVGVIKAIGKYTPLPYSRCLNLKKRAQLVSINNVSKDVINHLRREWRYGEYLRHGDPKDPLNGRKTLMYQQRDPVNTININYFHLTKKRDVVVNGVKEKIVDDGKIIRLDGMYNCKNYTKSNNKGTVSVIKRFIQSGYSCGKFSNPSGIISQDKLLFNAMKPYAMYNKSYQNKAPGIILSDLASKFVKQGFLPKKYNNEQLFLVLRINMPFSEDSRWLVN